MAVNETNIVHAIMKEVSNAGGRCWKNVRGFFYTKEGTPIKAGLLCDGSSDLIGYRIVTITSDMVGKRIAQFMALEIKIETGRVSPEQANFITHIKENGGLSGVLRCKEDLIILLK